MADGKKITAVQGDTLGPITFTFKNVDGTPFDLTGSDLILRIHATGDAIELTSANLTDGLELTDAEGGIATLTLTPEQTSRLFIGVNSEYRLRRSIGGETRTLTTGFFEVSKGGP
jgi:hypothetical protein